MGRASSDPYAYWFVAHFKEALRAMYPNVVNDKFSKSQLKTYFNQYTTGDGAFIRTSTAEYDVVSLKGKITSKAETTYSNISAGKNITINGSELNMLKYLLEKLQF